MQSNGQTAGQGGQALEKLFTPQELERAGIASCSKLQKDRIKGIGIPFVYVGRRVRYRASDVDAYLQANKATRALQLPDSDRRKTAMSARARAMRAQSVDGKVGA